MSNARRTRRSLTVPQRLLAGCAVAALTYWETLVAVVRRLA
jgi:hypothetical protein